MSNIATAKSGGFFSDALLELSAIAARYETIGLLVSTQLKEGHRDKLLGHLWNLLDPLLLMAVYFVVFGLVLRLGGDDPVHFLLYLFVGVLLWRFLDASVTQATLMIRNNRGLVHEIRFPKGVLPVAACLARLYDVVWGILVMWIVMAVAAIFTDRVHFPLNLNLLWGAWLLLMQTAFVAGLSLAVAFLGAFYTDTANVTSVALRLWVYASPVFYFIQGPHAAAPEWLRGWLLLNPMAAFMEDQRAVLIFGQAPSHAGFLTIVGLGALAAGLSLFRRGEGAFVRYV
jgi:ABC-type polysaccharide/polyol phosphate export permease